MREKLIAEIDRLQELAADIADMICWESSLSPLFDLIEKYNRMVEAMS